MSQIYKPGSGGGGGSNVETLTGNSGGAVSPTANNIDTIGTGSITVVGNPGTSTLTAELTGLTQYNLLIGQGTTTIGLIAPSATTGYVLTSNGSASNPSFQILPSSSCYFQAYLTSPQTIAGGSTSTTIIYDTALVNMGSGYNTSTGIFTAPATGYYSFSTITYFTNITSLTGNTQLITTYTGSFQSVRLNYVSSGIEANSDDAILNGTWAMPMTAGDTVQIQPFATGSGNYEIYGEALSSAPFSSISTFSGFRIA